MRPTKRLYNLQKSTIKRLSKLRNIALNSIQNASSLQRESDLALSFVVIDLLNTWGNFCRSYYLSCILKPKLNGGSYITISSPIADFNNAIGLAVRIKRRNPQPNPNGIWNRRDEPAWHDPNNLMTLCGNNNLGCSNFANIQSAFSLGSQVYADLPIFRNFFAHRNKQSESSAMQCAPRYSISSVIRPSAILLSRPLNRPKSLILDWIDDIELTVEYLCY